MADTPSAHCTCESWRRGKGALCLTCGKPIDLMASLEDSLRPQSSSHQVPGRARYALTSLPASEPDLCRFCGAGIVQIEDHWYTLEGNWPNLAHCHYSARNSTSVGHEPERGAS